MMDLAFNGLGLGLGNLARLSNAKTRSRNVSPRSARCHAATNRRTASAQTRACRQLGHPDVTGINPACHTSVQIVMASKAGESPALACSIHGRSALEG